MAAKNSFSNLIQCLCAYISIRSSNLYTLMIQVEEMMVYPNLKLMVFSILHEIKQMSIFSKQKMDNYESHLLKSSVFSDVSFALEQSLIKGCEEVEPSASLLRKTSSSLLLLSARSLQSITVFSSDFDVGLSWDSSSSVTVSITGIPIIGETGAVGGVVFPTFPNKQ